ncbi:hypothetical protein BD414DRAFT_535831 [Trametes punicea]|nr:hypothetical protein BD414DRAFT_535831 [Trametes punicea]
MSHYFGDYTAEDLSGADDAESVQLGMQEDDAHVRAAEAKRDAQDADFSASQESASSSSSASSSQYSTGSSSSSQESTDNPSEERSLPRVQNAYGNWEDEWFSSQGSDDGHINTTLSKPEDHGVIADSDAEMRSDSATVVMRTEATDSESSSDDSASGSASIANGKLNGMKLYRIAMVYKEWLGPDNGLLVVPSNWLWIVQVLYGLTQAEATAAKDFIKGHLNDLFRAKRSGPKEWRRIESLAAREWQMFLDNTR